ncbi:MAG: hypothetical protein H5T71_05815, partial [Chloroflexi bacterium]|nr:hypothetical protein [Chloroflexota bacterium]
ARDLIRDVAAQATAHYQEIAPFVISGPPYTQEIRICGRTDAQPYLARGCEQVDACTFIKRADRLQDLLI